VAPSLHRRGAQTARRTQVPGGSEKAPLDLMGKPFKAEARTNSAERDGIVPLIRLPAERLRRVRDRMITGFYDRPRVVEEIARRLIESGDLHRNR